MEFPEKIDEGYDFYLGIGWEEGVGFQRWLREVFNETSGEVSIGFYIIMCSLYKCTLMHRISCPICYLVVPE